MISLVYLGGKFNFIEGTRQNNFVTSVKKVLITWINKIGGSDCLLKTQDSDKYNN